MHTDPPPRYAAPEISDLYAAALARQAEGHDPLADPAPGAVTFLRCDTQPDGGTAT